MPTPNDGESRDDFVSRCIPIVLEDETAEDQDQAIAVCNSMWEESKSMADHSTLLKAVKDRNGSRTEFGYGMTTADKYLKLSARYSDRFLSLPSESQDMYLRAASEKLVYCNEDMASDLVLPFDKAKGDDGFGKIALPENTLVAIRHIVTTNKEDRDGDILHTKGAVLDPKAPLLWQHQPFVPIGKVIKPVQHNASLLKVVSVVLDLNELTSDIAKLLDADVLRFSHGFRALEVRERKRKGEPQPDDVSPMGFDILKFEIMEVSLVSVPSNTDAVVELYSHGKLESAFCKAQAEELLKQRPVQVPGVDMDELTKDESEDSEEPEEDIESSWSSPSSPQDDEEDKQQDKMDTKSGRALSQRNADTLASVLEDLRELKDSELKRAQVALLEQCIIKLESVLKSAQTADDEEKTIDEDTEVKDEPLDTFAVYDAAKCVLHRATIAELEQIAGAIDAVLAVNAKDRFAEEYRKCVS